MNAKVRAVYATEMRLMIRDRRTVFLSVIIPIVLYPVLMLGTAEVAQIAKAKLDREELPVAVMPGTKTSAERIHKIALETPDPPKGLPPPETKKATTAPATTVEKDKKENADSDELEFKDSFKAARFVFQELPLENARRELAAGKIRAILFLPLTLDDDIAAQRLDAISIEYDGAERISQSAASRLQTMMERYGSVSMKQRLEKNALEPRFMHPFTLELKNTAKAEKMGGSILGGMLPFIFIMMLLAGAMHPAIDLTAGEKERATLETLVGTPARPLEIIAGKFLTVATLSLVNAALNVGSFAVSFGALGLKNLPFQLPWSAVPLTLLLLIPLALFFSALLLMVSSFAASVKEAQIYCVPVYLIPVVVMTIAMTPGIELQGPLLIAPVINTALLIKELFLSHDTLQQILFVFISNCLYAAGMVALAARVFAREEVLFSAQGSLRMFLSRRFFKPTDIPKPGDALLAAAVFFPLNFYLQLWLAKLFVENPHKIDPRALSMLVIIPQYGLFFGAPLLIAKYLKARLNTTFQWRAPSLPSVAGAILMGSTSWLLASQIGAWLSRVWDFGGGETGLEDAIKQLVGTGGGAVWLIFLIALTPAICEEHFFRGFFQQGLGRRNKWSTLLLVGALFGVFHIPPSYRAPITGLFGMVIAYTAWQSRSIWPGVVMHFFHNSLTIFGPTLLGLHEEKPAPGQPLHDIPPQYLIPATAVFAIGLFIISRVGHSKAPEIVSAPPGKETLSS